MSLKTMLDSEDFASLVFRALDLYTLLKLSMTSKRMLSLVDSLAANIFAGASKFELRLCQHMRKMMLLHFDALHNQLFYEYVLERPSEKLRFMSNVHVHLGRLVSMPVEFEVPLPYVAISSSTIPKRVDIVVTLWKIVRIAFQDQHIGPRTDNLHGESLGNTLNYRLATVCMEALRFRVCDRAQIELPYAVTLILCNVPVCNRLSARARAVMCSCNMCMNCHQRPRMFEGIHAPANNYRVLCRICFAHLFVPEYSLQNTWRISKKRLFDAREGFMVYTFVSGGENRGTQRFHPVVLKLELARALGARDWDDFLRRNYKTPLPYSRLKCTGRERYGWSNTAYITDMD